MSNIDYGIGPLFQGLVEYVSYAPLSDQVHDITALGCYYGPLGQREPDVGGDLAGFIGMCGCQCKEAAAAFALSGSTGKVYLAAYTRILPGSVVLRTHLTGEVRHETRVY